MIGRFLASIVPGQMRGLPYPDQGEPAAGEVTREIIGAFLDAGCATLRGASTDQLNALEAEIPWYRRPFFWEGHGFGLAGLRAFSLQRGRPDEALQSPGYRYMYYTGLGMWNGIARLRFMPRVSLAPERWSEVEDYWGCRVLVAGGSAFADVVMRQALNPPSLAALAEGGDPAWQHGVYHGAGRAAWFLYMRAPERLTALLRSFEALGQTVAEGLGIAIAYTQLAEPERILEQIAALPQEYGASLRSGARLCLAAAAEDDSRLVDTIASLPEPLSTWYHQGAGVLAEVGRGPEMSERLIAGLHHFG